MVVGGAGILKSNFRSSPVVRRVMWWTIDLGCLPVAGSKFEVERSIAGSFDICLIGP